MLKIKYAFPEDRYRQCRDNRKFKRGASGALSLLDELFMDIDLGPFSINSLEHLGKSVEMERDGDDGIKATFQVPGYGKEDLELNYSEEVLSVKGKDVSNKLSYRTRLPKNVDPASFEANCDKGILTVTAKYKQNEKQVIDIK